MIKRLVFILFVFLWSLLAAKDTLKKEIPVEPGNNLTIDLKSGGTVFLTGWDQPKAEMTVEFANGDRSDWTIEFSKTDDGVTADCRSNRTSSRHHPPAFHFQVPRRFNVRVKTMGGGITIRHLEGKLDGRTMGGSLDLSNLNGIISMETMGGEITLTESKVDGKVHTMGGHVRIENVIGDIKGTSMGGNVIYKNVGPASGSSSGKTVKIKTMGGAIHVEEADQGAEVDTMGGDIHIHRARVFVNARTMGGDIRIDEVDGRVRATTMGGNIDIRMIGSGDTADHTVFLSSKGGDITLRVPKRWPMELELEIGLTRTSANKYRIQSDFPVTVTEEEVSGTSKHSVLKYIRGKGKTDSGKNKVVIETINGNIFLIENK